MLILSIDPGLTGAIAFLGTGWSKVLDLPTKQDPLVGNRIDPRALADLITRNVPDDTRVQVCIEAVANGGRDADGNSRTNAATVGSQFWTQSALVNTLELLGLEVVEYVHPGSWKRFYGLGGKQGKAADIQRRTRELAVSLYPDLEADLKLQKHHNRGDAILIGHWFRKVRL